MRRGWWQQVGVTWVEHQPVDEVADVVRHRDAVVDGGVVAPEHLHAEANHVQRLAAVVGRDQTGPFGGCVEEGLRDGGWPHSGSSGRAWRASRTASTAKWSRCSCVTSTAHAPSRRSRISGVKAPGVDQDLLVVVIEGHAGMGVLGQTQLRFLWPSDR